MINLDDASMIFTLNGELLITSKGSELAFADYEIDNGKSTNLPTPFHVHKVKGTPGNGMRSSASSLMAH